MASPICTVNGSSTINGVNVPAASSVLIALADVAGVKTWTLTCISTDDTNAAATVNADLSLNSITKQATFTAPAEGSALIFQSQVNGGKDANGRVDPSLTTTFGVYVLTATSLRVGAFDETTEGSAAFGWITKINSIIRNASLGAGSYGNGLAYNGGIVSVKPGSGIAVSAGGVNVKLDTDGSIAFAVTGGVKVGVLATDAQHGNRGGGNLHALASGATAGFMSSSHFTLVNGATSSATASTLAQRDASGNCAFGAVTCTGLKWGTNITQTRVSPSNGVLFTGSGWTYSSCFWTNTTLGAKLEFFIDPPQGAMITSIAVNYAGAAGHTGLPTTMPKVELQYYDVPSQNRIGVTGGSQSDTSGSTAAFQAFHSITANNGGAGINHVVDKTTRRYYVLVTAESGTNALTGAQTDCVVVSWTMPSGSNIAPT